MCGIAGCINLNKQPIYEHQLKHLTSVLTNRGPDYQGYFLYNHVGLAHTRLSIIDLSENAHQPMSIDNGAIVITFNGEIYNFKKLKQELTKKYNFKSNSDTEVILYLYKEHGIQKMLELIDGMFAFCIYDKTLDKTYLCRDRFGKKPLYYLLNGTQLIFSSDIRSFHKLPNVTLTINQNSIDYYLTELSSPQPYTIYNEIEQVPPSSVIEIDLVSGSSIQNQYWTYTTVETNLNISEEEAIKKTESYLIQAIEKRLESDVPIACFLSGGADSGLITSLYAQLTNKQVNTYTVGFTYEDHNELPYANALAKKYNTNHNEIILEPHLLKDIDFIIDQLGEPFADSSSIPTYYITKEISKDFKVALSGDGGDEVFGGYYEYAWANNTDNYFLKHHNSTLRKIDTLVNKIAYKTKLTKTNVGLYDSYHNLSGDLKLYRQMGFSYSQKNELLLDKKATNTFTKRYLSTIWNDCDNGAILETLFKSSFKTRLLNDYLVKVDRMSMANSLEVRSPFLDKQLAEWALSIPNSIKLKNGTTKYILKQLAEKHIDSNFSARKKQGFGIPLKYWINDELRTFIDSILFSDELKKRTLLDITYIQKIVNEHRSGKCDHTDRIWAITCLELWFRKFID